MAYVLTENAKDVKDAKDETDVKCSICFESNCEIVQFCSDPSSHIDNQQICSDCVVEHISQTIKTGYNGFCPTINCPLQHTNKKKPTLMYHGWSEYITKKRDESNIHPYDELASKLSIIHTYDELANKLLNVRCGMCDKTKSLLPAFKGSFNSSEYLGNLVIVHKYDVEDITYILRQIMLYKRGSISVSDAYNKIIKQYSDTSLINLDLDTLVINLLKTIKNPEKRANMYLRHIKYNPIVQTVCCGEDVCFKCKRMGYHSICIKDDEHDDNNIARCPNCDMLIVKSEGCDSMSCQCGHSFNWRDVEYFYETSFENEYPDNTIHNCIAILSDFNNKEYKLADRWAKQRKESIIDEMCKSLGQKYGIYCTKYAMLLKRSNASPWTIEAASKWLADHKSEIDKYENDKKIIGRSLFEIFVPKQNRSVIVKNMLDNNRYYFSLPKKVKKSTYCDYLDNDTYAKVLRAASEWQNNNFEQFEQELLEYEKNQLKKYYNISIPNNFVIKQEITQENMQENTQENIQYRKCKALQYSNDFIASQVKLGNCYSSYPTNSHTIFSKIDRFPACVVNIPSMYINNKRRLKNYGWLSSSQFIIQLCADAANLLSNNKRDKNSERLFYGFMFKSNDNIENLFTPTNASSEWVDMCEASDEKSLKCVVGFYAFRKKLETIFGINHNEYTDDDFFNIKQCPVGLKNIINNPTIKHIYAALSWLHNNYELIGNLDVALMAEMHECIYEEDAAIVALLIISPDKLNEYKLNISNYEHYSAMSYIAENQYKTEAAHDKYFNSDNNKLLDNNKSTDDIKSWDDNKLWYDTKLWEDICKRPKKKYLYYQELDKCSYEGAIVLQPDANMIKLPSGENPAFNSLFDSFGPMEEID
jgi:hypothetical protein